MSSFAIFAILSRRARRRPATAMSLADSGSGFAALAGLPLVYAAIEIFGWRATYVGLGALSLTLGVLLHALVFERLGTAPRRTATVPAGEGGARRVGAALPVALMCASYFCGSAAYHGLLTQQIALFAQEGIAPGTAVWAAAAAGGTVFLWRIVSGWLADVLGVGRVMIIAAIAAALTFLGLALALGGVAVAVFTLYPLALGIGFGGQQVLLAVGLRGISSADAYPQHLGFGRLASGLGMAAGPLIAGLTFDLTGMAAAVGALLAMLSLGHFAAFGAAHRVEAGHAGQRCVAVDRR